MNTVREAINVIEAKTGYYFLFNDELGKVSINDKSIEGDNINDILTRLLEGTAISFKVEGKVVYLTEDKSNETAAKTNKQDQKRAFGTVIDSNGETLIGVNVTEVGTSSGTVTDASGSFNIILTTQKPILKFSYIGFKDQEVTVGSKSVIDVIMIEDLEILDEVVVVGHGTQRRASVVGAITSVEPKKLQIGTTRSISNNLSGMIAGVIGVQRSGEPGWDDSSFWIRGISSFRGQTNPLVLVDGVERSLNNLDPEEIETISILKDAAASAVYGVRGANGVIVITTKRGEIGPAKVTVRAESGISAPTKLPSFINSADYLTLLNDIAIQEDETPLYSEDIINNYRTHSDPELYPDVDWLDLVTKDFTNNQRVNMNVSGGSRLLRYALETSYFGENGIIVRDTNHDWDSSIKLNRMNVRSNVDLNITPTTLMRVNIGGYLQNRRMPGSDISNIFSWSFTMPPFAHPPQYTTGEIPQRNAALNPWALATQTGFQTWSDSELQSLVSLQQDLKNWLPGLKAEALFAFDKMQRTAILRTKRPTYYNPAVIRDIDGTLILNVQSDGQEFLGSEPKAEWGDYSTYLEGKLMYDQNFGDHYINSMLLYNQREYNDGNAIPFRSQGTAARFSYSYARKYVGEFNFGYNGSENFAKGKRFGFFPSFALGWYLSEEEFMKPVKHIFPLIKFRGSWGLAGNDRIGGRRFAYLATIGSDSNGGYTYGVNKDYNRIGRFEGESAVPNLTWETVAKTNIGFELGVLNSLNLQLDFFKEQRSNIFMQRQTIPGQSGFIKTPWANYGKVDNKGFDLTLTYNKQFTRDFYFSLLHTLTYAKNTIIEIDEPINVIGTNRSQTGQSVNQVFGLVDLGLFTDNHFQKAADGSLLRDDNDMYVLLEELPHPTFGPVRPGDIMYKDMNNDGEISALDRSPIGGTVDPRLVYGIAVSTRYKNVDFGVFVQGQSETTRVISSGIIPGSTAGVNGNIYSNYLDHWSVDNPSQDVFYPRLATSRIENNTQTSTWWLRDMSLLRVKNLEVGYHLPKKSADALKITSGRVFFRGSNLLTFSGFDLWDPEVGTSNGFQYPIMKSVSVGLEVNF